MRSSPPLSAGPAAKAVDAPSPSLDQRPRGSRLRFVALLCAAAMPALLIFYLVLRFATAIPMLDDWEVVPLVTRAHTGGLTFAELFEQQQEARTFFPKLIFIALSFGKYWDSRAEMILSILVCALTSVGVYRLLSKSGLSAAARATAFLLSVVLIFSPAQHEVWLLASGFPSFVPALCVVWGLVVIRSRRSIVASFWLCAGLAFFASFTLSNGLLVWGLTFPVLFLMRDHPRWKHWLGSWFLAAAACAVLYFWKFHAPPDLPPFAPRKPILDYGRYVAAFLGSGLGRSGNENPLSVSVGAGTALLLGYFAALGCSIFRWRDRDLGARVAPWIALGGYSIGSGCLAALGRIAWGVSQALESRYVAFSIYLAVAMVAIVTIFATEFRKDESAKRRLIVFTGVVLVGASFLMLVLFCAAGSLPFFPIRSAAARLGQSGVLFSGVLDTSSTIQSGNHPRPFFVREEANTLDQLHLLRTPLVRTREIGRMRHANAGEGMAEGWVDGLTTGSNGARIAWGWAALPGRNRPADAVLLAYSDAKGEWVAFALSDAVFDRPDVARISRSSEQLWSGWRAVFSPEALPMGAEISAWAVDAKDSKLYRLKTKECIFNR